MTIHHDVLTFSNKANCTEQKLTELKGEIDGFTVIVGAINIPLTIMDRATRQKISKEIEDLT